MNKLKLTQSTYTQRLYKLCEERFAAPVSGSDPLSEHSLELLQADTLYKFLHNAKISLNESCLGYELGEELLAQDLQNLKGNGDALQMLVGACYDMSRQSNYAIFRFDIMGERMRFSIKRDSAIKASAEVPNEIFAGYIIGLLKHFVSSVFCPSDIIIQAPCTLDIPDEYENIRQIWNCNNELTINFPVYWVVIQNPTLPIVNTYATSLDLVRNFCRQHLTNSNWNIEQLARQCDFSVRSLQRLLKHHNLTFREIMAQEKLGRVKQMLCDDFTREEISFQLGFSDSSSLSRFFKRQTGQTLREYNK